MLNPTSGRNARETKKAVLEAFNEVGASYTDYDLSFSEALEAIGEGCSSFSQKWLLKTVAYLARYLTPTGALIVIVAGVFITLKLLARGAEKLANIISGVGRLLGFGSRDKNDARDEHSASYVKYDGSFTASDVIDFAGFLPLLVEMLPAPLRMVDRAVDEILGAQSSSSTAPSGVTFNPAPPITGTTASSATPNVPPATQGTAGTLQQAWNAIKGVFGIPDAYGYDAANYPAAAIYAAARECGCSEEALRSKIAQIMNS